MALETAHTWICDAAACEVTLSVEPIWLETPVPLTPVLPPNWVRLDHHRGATQQFYSRTLVLCPSCAAPILAILPDPYRESCPLPHAPLS